MNQGARNKMRAKHYVTRFAYDEMICPVCQCAYPCDVIRVLNAWESEIRMRNEGESR